MYRFRCMGRVWVIAPLAFVLGLLTLLVMDWTPARAGSVSLVLLPLPVPPLPGGALSRSRSLLGTASDGRVYADLGDLWVFDPVSASWSQVPGSDLPNHDLGSGLVTRGDQLFEFGPDRTDQFDLHSGRWVAEGAMPTPRRYPDVSEGLDGRIYVVGGLVSDPSSVGHLIEVFDPVSGAWSEVPLSPYQSEMTSDLHGVALGGKLYVVSGYVFSADNCLYVGQLCILPPVQAYDLNTQAWTKGARLPYALTGFSVVAALGRVYVIGGDYYYPTSRNPATADNGVLAYGPSGDTWDTAAVLSVPRTQPGVAVSGNWMYVLGGGSPNGDRFTELSRLTNTHYLPIVLNFPASGGLR